MEFVRKEKKEASKDTFLNFPSRFFFKLDIDYFRSAIHRRHERKIIHARKSLNE